MCVARECARARICEGDHGVRAACALAVYGTYSGWAHPCLNYLTHILLSHGTTGTCQVGLTNMDVEAVSKIVDAGVPVASNQVGASGCVCGPLRGTGRHAF